MSLLFCMNVFIQLFSLRKLNTQERHNFETISKHLLLQSYVNPAKENFCEQVYPSVLLTYAQHRPVSLKCSSAHCLPHPQPKYTYRLLWSEWNPYFHQQEVAHLCIHEYRNQLLGFHFKTTFFSLCWFRLSWTSAFYTFSNFQLNLCACFRCY